MPTAVVETKQKREDTSVPGPASSGGGGKPMSNREKKRNRRMKQLKKKGKGEQPELDTKRLGAYDVNTKRLKQRLYTQKRDRREQQRQQAASTRGGE